MKSGCAPPLSPQVPAAENAGEWPEKQLVDAWPVTERGGFVWLFYGSKDLPEEERPPIPLVPELEDGTWKPVYGSVRGSRSQTSACGQRDTIVLHCGGVVKLFMVPELEDGTWKPVYG